MRAHMRFIVLSGLVASVAACSLSSMGPLGGNANVPGGTIVFSKPAGGETYQMGDSVTLAWSCPDCVNVPAGDYLQVFAYDGVNGYLIDDSAAFNDSTSWVAGTGLQRDSLAGGTYQIVAQDAGGYYQSPSRFFQLVGNP
jgi:hypothetical protein